jgi:hypothetical protein
MEERVHTEADKSASERVSRGASVNKASVVNAINYLHSQNKAVNVVFRHMQYNTFETIEAFPSPCYEDYLHLSWKNHRKLIDRIISYELHQILVETGRCIFAWKPQIVTIDDKTICLDISQVVGAEVRQRRVERWSCRGVDVEMIQNGLSFRGTLKDCSGISFSAVMSCGSMSSFTYVNPEIGVMVLLKKREELLFSGECRVVRTGGGAEEKTFVFEPSIHTFRRFRRKTHRSRRHRLYPSPNVSFAHPFTGRIISRRIDELSGSGFSVIERYESCTLIAGMILPQVEIEFAHGVYVRCKAQVITRSIIQETSAPPDSETLVRSGVAILDMDQASQTLVASVLHQAADKNSYVCNRVDIDELLKFFFKTGFIYPKKYLSLFSDIESFRETYRKLYMETPDIARHFIYQDNGKILGHISMIRYFENSWLFHHHASVGISKAGLVVLDQIGRYLNDVFNMHSSHLQYALCYFRPENRFPNRVFGAFARHLANPKQCSLDDFAHVLLRKKQHLPPLPASTTLEQSTTSDLFELEDYYSYYSGGLMTAAFELAPSSPADMPIEDIYKQNGLKRERHLYSLKEGNKLKALFIANVSDAGLNMSNLTNCVTAFVLDGDTLPADYFLSACNKLTQCYAEDEIPFLVSPTTYAEKNALGHNKIYRLWSFDVQQLDHYLDFISHLVRKA